MNVHTRRTSLFAIAVAAMWISTPALGASSGGVHGLSHDSSFDAASTKWLFDGGNLDTAPGLNLDGQTIEALVQWNGITGRKQSILEKALSADGSKPLYGLSILEDGRVEARFNTDDTLVLRSLQALKPGTNSLALSFTPQYANLYINGVLSQMPYKCFCPKHQTGSGTMTVGGQPGSMFNGLIQRLAIYDTAEALKQITAVPVPLPGAVWLILSGLALLIARFKRSRS